MVVDWTLVYDNGDRPFVSDLPEEQRRPLAIRAGETVTINVKLVTPFGVPFDLGAGKLVLTARTVPVPSSKRLFAKDSTVLRGVGKYRFTLAAGDTRNILPQHATFDVWSVIGEERTAVVPLSELAIGRSGVVV